MANTNTITIKANLQDDGPTHLYNYKEWVAYHENSYHLPTEMFQARDYKNWLRPMFYCHSVTDGMEVSYGRAKNFVRALVKGVMDVIWANRDNYVITHVYDKYMHDSYKGHIDKERFFWRRFTSTYAVRETAKNLLFGRTWSYGFPYRDSIELHNFDRSPLAKAEELWNQLFDGRGHVYSFETPVADNVLIHHLHGDYRERVEFFNRAHWVAIFDQIVKFGEFDKFAEAEIARRIGKTPIRYAEANTYTVAERNESNNTVTIVDTYSRFEKDSGFVVNTYSTTYTYQLVSVDPKRVGREVFAAEHMKFIRENVEGEYNALRIVIPEVEEDDGDEW